MKPTIKECAVMPEFTCYVLQKEVRPGDIPLHDSPKTPFRPPDTVLFIDEREDDPAFKFRTHSREDILVKSSKYTLGAKDTDYYWGVSENGVVKPTKHLHQSVTAPDGNKPTGLVVPEEIVKHTGIASGDKVKVYVNDDEHVITIVSVNGETDFNKVRALPDKSRLVADYPQKFVPLGLYGHTVRTMELMAPIGSGSNVFVIGPGGSGKTSALLEVVYGLLNLAQKASNMRVIVVYLGERAKDVGLYNQVKTKVSVEDQAEFYIADENVSLKNQYATMRFAMERAWELVKKYDVYVVIDSLTRAVFAHSYGGYADREKSGMISGGIYTVSVEEAAREIAGSGYFQETGTSLTIFSSLLYSTDRLASAVVQFARETRDHKPDTLWTFMNNPSLRDDELENKGFPWASVNERESYTRMPPEWIQEKPYIPNKLVEEMADIREIWSIPDERTQRPPRAEDRHNRLVRYTEKHPIPLYAEMSEYTNLLE